MSGRLTVAAVRERLIARGWEATKADTLSFAVIHLMDAADELAEIEDRIADLWSQEVNLLADHILTDARAPEVPDIEWQRRKARIDAAQTADLAEVAR